MTSSFAGMRGGGLVSGGMASTDMLDAYMERAMSATPRTAAPAAQELVRIKCRNCGSLEADDATYCRKCGQAL
jgi:ribosomal protein L40E